MDDKIIGLYAAGLTVRDIQAHLLDLYGLKVSPDLISRVTDVLGEVREWQSRALWTAPTEWSGLIVSASSAAGLLG